MLTSSNTNSLHIQTFALGKRPIVLHKRRENLCRTFQVTESYTIYAALFIQKITGVVLLIKDPTSMTYLQEQPF